MLGRWSRLAVMRSDENGVWMVSHLMSRLGISSFESSIPVVLCIVSGCVALRSFKFKIVFNGL